VAPPWHRLGADNDGRLFCGQVQQFPDPGFKRRRLHIIGVTTEGFVPESLVHGINARVPQTAQRFHMPIIDSTVPEEFTERFLIELRIVPGSRDRPHIHKPPNAVRPKYFHQLI
jgi:hypothetical protein